MHAKVTRGGRRGGEQGEEGGRQAGRWGRSCPGASHPHLPPQSRRSGPGTVLADLLLGELTKRTGDRMSAGCYNRVLK